jgi:uncharacterized protein YecE (DUF72 family)
MGEIRVGTTSWAEKTLIECGRFYPPEVHTAEERLRFYASRFPVVEVDSTYYGMPTEHNTLLWATRTPPGFVFHVKAFRLFTQHPTAPEALPADVRRRLGIPPRNNFYYDDVPEGVMDELWKRFALALEPLRASGKLGAVLFQYPPWFVHRHESLAHVERCARHMNGDRVAVEFRNKSWFDERHCSATLEFERRQRVVHVVTDAPQGFSSSTPPVWQVTNPALAIVRLHGRNAATWQRATRTAAERFDYLYSEEELQSFVGPVRAMASRAGAVHVLFNNCRDDKAQRNAAWFDSALRR